MSQSRFDIYLERNAAFADTDAKNHVPEIPFIPLKQLYLITCIDPRVEPAAIVGSQLGEAIVARNVGGRVTPAVIKDLVWILHLHENKTPDAEWFEIAVIHHTDCGSGLLADDDLRNGYIERGGWEDAETRELAVLDPTQTVHDDIEKLRSAPELQSTIANVKIGGYVYDVSTGKLTTVVHAN
jgi:carbonic anhydrase